MKTVGHLHHKIEAAGLEQELATSAAGRKDIALGIDGNRFHQATTATAMEIGNDAAFSAESQSVRSILHIAARDDSPRVGACGGPHLKAGVGRVSVCGCFLGHFTKFCPIVFGHDPLSPRVERVARMPRNPSIVVRGLMMQSLNAASPSTAVGVTNAWPDARRASDHCL